MVTRSMDHFDLADLGGLHWAAVTLALATGLIHVYVGAVEGRFPLVLAGLGYFGGVVVFFAGWRDRRLYLVAVAYTAVQVLAWAIVNAADYTLLGYADKAVQLALIAVLIVLGRRQGRAPR